MEVCQALKLNHQKMEEEELLNQYKNKFLNESEEEKDEREK